MKNFARWIVHIMRRYHFKLRRSELRLQGIKTSSDVQVFGPLKVKRMRTSVITLGRGVTLNASSRRNTLESRGPNIVQTIRPDAVITVGDHTGMTSATISSAYSIVIGRNVLLGAGVMITDSDHHVVVPPPGMSRRFLGLPEADSSHGILIGDEVFIGARSIILKGVTVGDGAVIGAGSVVSKSIPPFAIAAGNPCRIVGSVAG